MTARTLLKMREEEKEMNQVTSLNVHKVTRFRKGGEEELEREIKRLERLKLRAARGEEEEGSKDEAENDAEEWVDEELVQKIEVPPSFLKRRKNESVRQAMQAQGGKVTASIPKGPHRHERRKMAREAAGTA